jgi:glutathione S-transferase
VNANGSIPALLDGALSIGESHTTLRYLVGRFELDDRWYPRELQARARVDEQLDWHHAHSRKGVPYFFHRYVVLPFFGGKPDRAAEAAGKDAYVRALEFLNANQLAKRPFLAAEHITIADLACYAELGPMRFDADLGPRVGALPNVLAWMERIAALPWHDAVHGEVNALVRRGGVPALGRRGERSQDSR